MDNNATITAALIEWCGIDLEGVMGPGDANKNLEEVVRCLVWTLKQDARARRALMSQLYDKDEE
jgi:hypothetical protein